MEIRVECYAGHRGEQEPRRLDLAGRAVEVVSIEDRWYGPDHRYFKVWGGDGAEYILRHEEREGRWEITLYRRGGRSDSA